MGYQDNLNSFNMEIGKFAAGIPDKVVVFQKKIVLEALRRIVMRTPVDTGRAKGNWQVSINEPAEGTIDEGISPNISDGEVIEKGLVALATLPPYSVVWIANNLEYIEFLEHGSSKKAPDGMVALAVQELEQMFKK